MQRSRRSASTKPGPTPCSRRRAACSAPAGRLALLEWGPPDPLTRLVDETIAAYAVEEAGDFLAGMRELAAWWRPWDKAVEDCADIADLLRAAGFRAVACEAVIGRASFARAEDFIRYALAWSPRRAEVDAMPAPAREECLAALRAQLGAGALTWAPPLFRASARR
ncbi:MAG: hypothetical protein M5R40_01735 [Anaerolineae bacterium]|nr:hypothetical protein [Anaerolineae bacterium]